MTIATWPSELPKPDRDTWSRTDQDARRNRQSETGPPLPGRPRYSNAAKLVSLSLYLDRNEKAVFDNFFEFETRRGSLLFWMPDPTTDGWRLFHSDGSPILISGGTNDGEPLLLAARWLCSFGKTLPSEAVVGTRFRISFSVTVMP